MKISEGENINFNKYGNKDCRKSIVERTEQEKQLTKNGT
jgi:hypothetical protein